MGWTGGYKPDYVYCLGCQGGEVEVVELLLDAGAEVNHAAQDKTMAVHLASAAKETKCQPCPPYTPPLQNEIKGGTFLQKCLDPISICLYSFYNKKAKLKCFFFSLLNSCSASRFCKK